MTALAADDLTLSFQETNSRLQHWLEGFADPCARPVTPRQVAALLSELMRAGERLRTLPPSQSQELQQELDQYRRNVERLRESLPSIQHTLLEERARLEEERGRLRSAADWARSSRQTL